MHRFLYPDSKHVLPAEALVPYHTQFCFTKKDHYGIFPVGSLRWRAPLFRPPRFNAGDPPYEFVILCEDIYGHF